jgi:hypothetical protein
LLQTWLVPGMIPMESAYLTARLDAGLLWKAFAAQRTSINPPVGTHICIQKCVCNQRDHLFMVEKQCSSCYQRIMLARWQQGLHYPAGWCTSNPNQCQRPILLLQQHKATRTSQWKLSLLSCLLTLTILTFIFSEHFNPESGIMVMPQTQMNSFHKKLKWHIKSLFLARLILGF